MLSGRKARSACSLRRTAGSGALARVCFFPVGCCAGKGLKRNSRGWSRGPGPRWRSIATARSTFGGRATRRAGLLDGTNAVQGDGGTFPTTLSPYVLVTVNFPFLAIRNCTADGLAVAAPHTTLLAEPTRMEQLS